jgi:hypothetical protein
MTGLNGLEQRRMEIMSSNGFIEGNLVSVGEYRFHITKVLKDGFKMCFTTNQTPFPERIRRGLIMELNGYKFLVIKRINNGVRLKILFVDEI